MPGAFSGAWPGAWLGQRHAAQLRKRGLVELEGDQGHAQLVAGDPGRELIPDGGERVDEELEQVMEALKTLPLRQQQTFLLRAWQELSTRETAFALAISENSVKTHYARATRQLRRILGDDDE